MSQNRPSLLAQTAPVFALVSGFSALVYEVLWLRQLGLLFGNTADAAATGFSIFFAGLALGGWIFGRRCDTLRRPLARVRASFYYHAASVYSAIGDGTRAAAAFREAVRLSSGSD